VQARGCECGIAGKAPAKLSPLKGLVARTGVRSGASSRWRCTTLTLKP
jgi:hypothetical protein